MLRRRRRTAKQRAWLRVKQSAPVGIDQRPPRRVTDRIAHAAQKRLTHDKVWARNATCQYCKGRRWACREDDQMHHDPPLSATRGQAPEVRTNTTTCGRACPRCHEDLTGTIGRKMTTQFLSDQGFNGPLLGIYVGKDVPCRP